MSGVRGGLRGDGAGYRRNAGTGRVEARVTATSAFCAVTPADAWLPIDETATFALATDETKLDVTWSGVPSDAVVSQGGRRVSFQPLEPGAISASVTRLQNLTVAEEHGALIACFDAIFNATNDVNEVRHDSSATSWVDHVTRTAFPLETQAAQGDTWTDDAYVLNGTKSCFAFASGLPQLFTVQYLITDTEATMMDSASDSLWWQYGNVFKFDGVRVQPTWTYAKNEPFAFASYTNWCGTSIATSAWHQSSHSAKAFASTCYAGGYGTDSSSVGEKIRFVRVYDRLLTDDERRVNYILDKMRYLGLSGADAADALGDGYAWDDDLGMMTVRVSVRVASGEGTVRMNGETATEKWIPIDRTARLLFTPASGLGFGAWSGLPDDAVSTNETDAAFLVRKPTAITVSCAMPTVDSVTVRSFTADTATFDYVFSTKPATFRVCFGSDPENFAHTNEFACMAATGSFTISGYAPGVRCYVQVSFPYQGYRSYGEVVSFVPSGVYFVSPSGLPGNDGTSWAAAVPFTNALALAAQNADACEIWVAGTNAVEQTVPTVTFASGLVVRGGFAGTEETASQRPAGTVSVLDGLHTNDVCRLSNAGEARFERLCFYRSYSHGLVKHGAGDLVLEDCLFLTNGVNPLSSAAGDYDGKGLLVTSADGARITLRRCDFRGNRLDYANAGNLGAGGIAAKSGTRLVLEDCGFYGNGQRLKVANSNCSSGNPDCSYFSGAAILSAIPVTATGCRFVGNTVGVDWAAGGIVRLNGAAGGSAFTNCVWAANQNLCNWGGVQYETTCNWLGALVVQLSAQDAKVDVAQCTFAHNLACGWYTSAGLNVAAGTVHVVNSAFGGNILSSRARMTGRDIHVKTNATCEIEYSLLSGTSTNGSVGVRAGGIWKTGKGVIFGDARFATPSAAISDLVRYNGAYAYFEPGAATHATLESADVHLRGKQGYLDEVTGTMVYWRGERSPAIAAADPASDCSREPTPNLRRANLGFYGNTPYATRAGGGTRLLAR